MGNPALDFEEVSGLSPTEVARLLGYARPTYYQYRRTGVLPLYATRHIQVLTMLSEADLSKLIREHVYGNDNDI